MKSLSDVLPIKKPREHPINIYLHEKNFESLARALLFLTIMNETTLAKRERMEIFTDIYGNCMLRERTATYLEEIVPELIQLITDDERCKSVIKPILNFENLLFKERD